jgi:hypothetical protein
MKTYEPRATSNPDIFRVVDRAGNWDTYYIKSLDLYIRAATAILKRGYAMPGLLQWAKNHTAEEAEQILQVAGDRGDAVHQAIALILSGVQVDRQTKVLADNNVDYRNLTDSEWDCILSFERFWNAHQPKLIAFEQTVANVQDGYAGTLDAIIRLTKSCGARCCNCTDFVGYPVLVDWKTSGGIWDNYGAQVAAYAMAWQERPMPIHSTGIVRLGTNHKTTGGYQCEFYNPKETLNHYMEFLAAKRIDDASYRPFDPAKEIFDIPETLSLTIEREEAAVPAKPKKSRKPRAKKAAAKSTKKAA